MRRRIVKKARHFVQFTVFCTIIIAVFVVEGNAEKWCPFGGVEAIYTYIAEGNTPCSLGVSNFYILAAVLVTTLLVKRSFCGYLCPIGMLSETTRGCAAKLGIKPYRVSEKTDRFYSMGKYFFLAILLYFTYRSGELIFRGFDPCYALLSRHGEDITFWAYLVSAAILIASFFINMPFCRWICPLAAVLNPFSWFGVARIQRNEGNCTSCAKCSRVCPMSIPVHKVSHVTHARCISCFECIESCPEKDALSWTTKPKNKKIPTWGILVVIFFFVTLAVVGDCLYPIASFIKIKGEQPEKTAHILLPIENLTCRGRANLLTYYLHRDDMHQIKGYLKIEAWPGPGFAKTIITYNPSLVQEEEIKEAITEPYYDMEMKVWRNSPFKVQGYDPLDASIK